MAARIRITCEFMVCWNTCAVPAKLPRTVDGTQLGHRAVDGIAGFRQRRPVGRLKEMVDAADSP
jgi:hypothetical protein